MPADKTPSTPALEKALTLLETLAKSRKGLTLSDLTRSLGLPKSSLHCLLLTLERRGYLQRNGQAHRYMFGLKFYSLANMALTRVSIRDIAGPFLHTLMEKTGLTVHMAILEQGEAVLVDKVEPPGLLRLATWVGKRMDVHCSGVGKALIASLARPELDQILSDHFLPHYNENTIVSRRKLEACLEHVRNLGYALDDEEGELGFRCIGSPIFDHTEKAIAAISVAGPTSKITLENRPSLAEKVKRTAHAISRQLGSAHGTRGF